MGVSPSVRRRVTGGVLERAPTEVSIILLGDINNVPVSKGLPELKCGFVVVFLCKSWIDLNKHHVGASGTSYVYLVPEHPWPKIDEQMNRTDHHLQDRPDKPNGFFFIWLNFCPDGGTGYQLVKLAGLFELQEWSAYWLCLSWKYLITLQSQLQSMFAEQLPHDLVKSTASKHPISWWNTCFFKPCSRLFLNSMFCARKWPNFKLHPPDCYQSNIEMFVYGFPGTEDVICGEIEKPSWNKTKGGFTQRPVAADASIVFNVSTSELCRWCKRRSQRIT